ncbi:MAG TPA: START domain-containing protein, partial [Puia sp.]|nr:START domain-containing protein [Puia sp.]
YTILLLSGVWFGGNGQDDWALKNDKDGIKVYTRTFPDSKFKAIRVELELETTLSRMVAVLLDVNSGADWIYGTKSSVLLKKVSPTELYYYSEVNIPWPFDNRDFIARLRVTQDSVTKVVTIDGPTVADYLPPKKDIVRVTQSEGKWVITPVGKDHVRIEYTLRTDPGGDIPAWLFNLFVTKGPTESFGNLKEQLKKPTYAQVHLPFIVE